MQAGIRAFIVDNDPTHQQESANAWAGRITGFGNILGYLSGYVELPKILPFLGDTQFKVLCAIAAVALGGTVTISCLCIRERDPRLEGPPAKQRLGLVTFFTSIWTSMRRLPPQTKKVCQVQFFNWMGWFPFLFYITTYIGQLEVNPLFEENPHMTPDEIKHAWEKATRIGTFALFIFAITSFTSNMILPFIIAPTYQPTKLGASAASLMPSKVTQILAVCQIPWLTIRRAWMLSHCLYALCMVLTIFITTPRAATVLVGLIGLPWALTIWAPFALISADISKRDAAKRARKSNSSHGLGRSAGGDVDPEEDVADQAGVVLGLHNVAVSAPQIVATLISSIIFKLTQKPRGVAGDDSVGWVLRIGGIAALVAAYMTYRVEEERGKDDRSGSESV